MAGFVRAVAVEERLLLGRRPAPGDHGLAVIDEARRDGLRMILMSGRKLEELGRSGALLSHFDGVVADSGAVLSVGNGPSQWMPWPSRRAGLLEVLRRLDIDPHDALGVSGDADTDLIDAVEVWVVVAGGDRGDFQLADSGSGALERVLAQLHHGWPAVSPPRHDVRLERGGGRGQPPAIVVPGGHANLLVCASPHHARDIPLRLASRWSNGGYQTLIIDLGGWSAGWSAGWGAEGLDVGIGADTNGIRVDARSSTWMEELMTAMHTHRGTTMLALSALQGHERSEALGAALSGVRALRARTGRPHWLVIDPVEQALSDADLQPDALDLQERGHCLVLRQHDTVPRWLVGAVDVLQSCASDCVVPPRGPAPGTASPSA